MVKDWKEHWDAKDMQDLLDQAKAKGFSDHAFYEVPSNAFCDSDTLALGPRDMRCDVKTAELLHDFSAIELGQDKDGYHKAVEAEVHGSAFWLMVPEDQREEIVSTTQESELKAKLLPILGQWVTEEDWLALTSLQEA
jgi:hypothetical protein